MQAQAIDRILADLVYDPFVAQEQAESDGDLLAHYQVPLIDGEDVFMAFKTGSYISCTPPGRPDLTPFPCGPNAWTSQIFNQRRLRWENGQLVTKWNFETDWKPMSTDFVGGWEPVYHAALANGFVYDAGAAGIIFKLDRETGAVAKRINPFGSGENARNTFVAGPPTADRHGNIYYNAIKIDPVTLDTVNSWLVKVDLNDNVSKVEYVSLLSSVNPPTLCTGAFGNDSLPAARSYGEARFGPVWAAATRRQRRPGGLARRQHYLHR